MAREGDYNFKGSALERGAAHEPREDPETGYGSTFLDKTKIATPDPKGDSAITLENKEGKDNIVEGNYNLEGSALDRGVAHEPRVGEDGYTSTFLDKTKIETPDPRGESAITLENTEGENVVKGNYNFEGSALDRGVVHEPKRTESGSYASTFLDKTKIPTPDPTGESAITLENTEGEETKKGNYNFEGSALERGVKHEPRVGEDGSYSSTYLDKTKIETPDPAGESAVTLENTEGKETKTNDFNFEGSAFDRGLDKGAVGFDDTEQGTFKSDFLEKTKIPTPAPAKESAMTLENST